MSEIKLIGLYFVFCSYAHFYWNEFCSYNQFFYNLEICYVMVPLLFSVLLISLYFFFESLLMKNVPFNFYICVSLVINLLISKCCTIVARNKTSLAEHNLKFIDILCPCVPGISRRANLRYYCTQYCNVSQQSSSPQCSVVSLMVFSEDALFFYCNQISLPCF